METSKIIARFSVWNKEGTVLFDTDSYDELVEEIGDFSAPLRRIGDNINVSGVKREITNIYFGVSESITPLQIVIEVK